ncbi:MAG: hypothetical protein HC860_25425 [Alkalinema sp. RU_4_3]|nr:hypothetical protein [Alkalinema sp. RU_4_3]
MESYFLSPIYGSLRNDLRPNGIYRQTSNSSCAAAALATLLRDWQVPQVSESSVAKYAQTSRLGTTMPQVIAAAQKFGFDGVELKLTWEQLLQINRPGLLAVWGDPKRRRDPHAMVLMAMDRTRAIVADPAVGRFLTYGPAQFDRLWRREFVPIVRQGELDLSGNGLKALYASSQSKRGEPTLEIEAFNDRQVRRMGCERSPDRCPW